MVYKSGHSLVETSQGEVEAILSQIDHAIATREPRALDDPLSPILPYSESRELLPTVSRPS
jgi:hypothetical protein